MEDSKRLALLGLILGLLLGVNVVDAAVPPDTWMPVGLGGGGALYGPFFSPHDPNELYVNCDMSQLFHSVDAGNSWEIVDFRQLQTNGHTLVRFTDDPLVRYAGDGTVFTGGGFVVSKTTDGGVTWVPVAGDPTGGATHAVFVDPTDPERLLIASSTQLFLSSDGGDNFAPLYTTPSTSLHLAGAFFDGTDLYAATSDGMLLSQNDGTFAAYSMPGYPSGAKIAAFAAARSGGTTRFLILTASNIQLLAVPGAWMSTYTGLYRADLGGSWSSATAGLGAGEKFAFLGMAENDVNVAYVIGHDPAAVRMRLYKSTDGGASWAPALLTNNNQNIATGWAGVQADPNTTARWWNDWPQTPRGLGVSPLDSQIVGFTDGGFTHVSDDGGASWRQVYVPQAQQNPVGTGIPHPKSYASIGFESTVAHWLLWLDPQRILAGYSDIQGAYSGDAGATWTVYNTDGGQPTTFNPDGLKDINQLIHHPIRGTVYGSTASIGPLYRAPIITDAFLDRPGGRVLATDDGGASWTTLHDFGHGVATIALDPTNWDRMYVGVVHSTAGGIYVSQDISAANPVFAPVTATAHPRMEGHPARIHVLSDGTVVAAFSARKPTNGSAFNATSGVFVLTPGASQWEDRSDPAFFHYTRDLVIDPEDEHIWYVGTFSSWNNVSNIPGGLYRSRNAGGSWQKLLDQPVESCTINPDDPNEMYVTVDRLGLWHTNDLTADFPTITPVDSYPFRGPERVFFEPGATDRVWVTNFGNGLRLGVVAPPSPTATATFTASATPNATQIPSATPIPTEAPTASETAVPTGTATALPSATATEVPTVQATATPPPCATGALLTRAKLTLHAVPFRLSFGGQAVVPEPWIAIDPMVRGVQLTIDSASGGGTLSASIPGGAFNGSSGWTLSRAGTTWRYRDSAGSHGGLTKVTVRNLSHKTPGLLKITARGRADAAVLPDVASVRATVAFGAASECALLTWNGPTGMRPNCGGDTAMLRCR